MLFSTFVFYVIKEKINFFNQVGKKKKNYIC